MRFSAGYSGIIANLSLIIVTPGEGFPILCTHHTVQRPTRQVNHILVRQRTKDTLGSTLVGIIAMTETEVVPLAPVI